MGQGKLVEAESMMRELLVAARKKLLENQDPLMASSLDQVDLGHSLNTLGGVLVTAGKLIEAAPVLREALAHWKKTPDTKALQIATGCNHLAACLQGIGELTEAELMCREGLVISRKLLGEEHPDVADSRGLLAAVLCDQGKIGEAEIVLHEALAIARNTSSSDPERMEDLILRLAEYLYRQSKFPEAEAFYREALASRSARLPAEAKEVTDPKESLGQLLADWAWAERGSRLEAGDLNSEIAPRAHEAETNLRDCLAIRLRGDLAAHWETHDARSRLGGALVAVAVTDATLSSDARGARLTEAESLLLESYKALQKNESTRRTQAERTQRDALTRFVRLYTAWDKPDKAAEWQLKLTDFNAAASLNENAYILDGYGKFAEAETNYREALAGWRKLYGNEHPKVAASLNMLGVVLGSQRKFGEAETKHREALATRKKLFGSEHADVAQSLYNLGVVLSKQNKHSEAETMHREALAMRRKLFGGVAGEVAASLNDLGTVLFRQGNLPGAESMLREALLISRKLFGNEHWEVATRLQYLAHLLTRKGDLSEAESMLHEAVAMRRKFLGDEHQEVVSALLSLAVVHEAQGELEQAETLLREAAAIEGKAPVADVPDDADTALNDLLKLLRKQGKLPEAESLYRKELERVMKLSGDEHPQYGKTLTRLANLLREQDRLTEAEMLHRQALAIARKSGTEKPWDLEAAMLELAEDLYRQNKYAESEALYREALGSRQPRLGKGHGEVITTCASLARLLADWAWDERGSLSGNRSLRPEIPRRAREAERLLRGCLEIRQAGGTHWRTDDVRSRLGMAVLAVAVTDNSLTGEARDAVLAEAETLLLDSNDALQQARSTEKKYKRDSLIRIVRLYETWQKPDQAGEWRQKLEALR